MNIRDCPEIVDNLLSHLAPPRRIAEPRGLVGDLLQTFGQWPGVAGERRFQRLNYGLRDRHAVAAASSRASRAARASRI